MKREPRRMAELEASERPRLALAIQALRGDDGSNAEVARLARRLAPQLAVPATPLPPPANGVGMGAGVKLWLPGVLVVLGAGLLLRVELDRPTPSPAKHDAVPARPAQAPASAPPVVPEPEPEPEPEPDHVTLDAPIAPQPRRATAPAASAPAPERELDLLQRSQAALDRDPTAALALAEQHARDYPRGVFAQERELLALEALLKLHRKPAAVARAQRFVQRFPDSPHVRRVRALLERSQPAGATIPQPPGDSSENLRP